MTQPQVQLAAIDIGGDSEPWLALGLDVDAYGRVPFSNGALEFVGGAAGIVGLAVEGVPDLAPHIDGVQIRQGESTPAIAHPLGVLEIDHVVVMTDSLERTSDAFHAVLGLECRRIRETDTVRQAFHRFDPRGGRRGCIIEIVENARVRTPSLFGLVLNLVDLDESARLLGPDVVGTPKSAVQPGRRIATVRGSAGLHVPVALMSPDG
jgi:hypothetical protein